MARANTSIAPPAGSGTMIRTGRDGYLPCAKAFGARKIWGARYEHVAATQAAASTSRRKFMDSSRAPAGLAHPFLSPYNEFRNQGSQAPSAPAHSIAYEVE